MGKLITVNFTHQAGGNAVVDLDVTATVYLGTTPAAGPDPTSVETLVARIYGLETDLRDEDYDILCEAAVEAAEDKLAKEMGE